jgi:glycosyltransferase involved in cell wall biosynthesis
MQSAAVFVQHSVVAPDNDHEGTPVAILEAGASGLPVVATRHAGIPDVVKEGETGYLVDEGDTDAMARYMIQLAKNPDLARRLGAAAREHIAAEYNEQRSNANLWHIIKSVVTKQPDL